MPYDSLQTKCFDSLLLKYTTKSLELKALTDIVKTNYEVLEQQQNKLQEETKELVDINYSVWAAEDTFCNTVWNFSSEHDFSKLFDEHHSIEDPYFNDKQELELKREQEVTLEKLQNEIDEINNEISAIRSNNIEQQIENASIILNKQKSFSEEILNVTRLINIPSSSGARQTPVHFDENNVSGVNNKQDNDEHSETISAPLKKLFQWNKLGQSNTSEFVNAKKLLKKPNNRPRALIGKKVTTIRTVAQKSEEHNKTNEGRGFSKFVVKKRSLISLRLERSRRCRD